MSSAVRDAPPPALPLPSASALNRRRDWFADPSRPPNAGPFVIVVDDFHPDPHAVRELALRQRFVQYSPPLAEQVGRELAAAYDFPPAWFATALLRHKGEPVRHPVAGFRHAPPEARDALARVVGESILDETWHTLGDGWNGAFHVQNRHWTGACGAIHHHYKDGDVVPRGWSGVVYLSPDAPPSAGTSIWRERASGLCVAPKGAQFHTGPAAERFDLALLAENRFNRLVLCRESVLHRAEHGFGDGLADARLTQTFFFRTTAA